jgi:hypothetical protein
MFRTKKTAQLSYVMQYPQAKHRRVEQEGPVAEKEAPLAEQAPPVAEEEHFGWSSDDDEGERNLEDDEDAANVSDEDESLQVQCGIC